MYITRKLSHFLCDTAYAFGFDDANSESPQSSDVFWAVTSAYAAAVFVIVPIDNIVAAVLDAPVSAVDVKKTLASAWFGVRLVIP